MQSAVPWISEPAAVAGFALATSINLGRGLNLRSPSFRGATRSGGRPIPDPICQKSVRPAVHNVTCRAGPFQLVCAYGDKADSPPDGLRPSSAQHSTSRGIAHGRSESPQFRQVVCTDRSLKPRRSILSAMARQSFISQCEGNQRRLHHCVTRDGIRNRNSAVRHYSAVQHPLKPGGRIDGYQTLACGLDPCGLVHDGRDRSGNRLEEGR